MILTPILTYLDTKFEGNELGTIGLEPRHSCHGSRHPCGAADDMGTLYVGFPQSSNASVSSHDGC